MWAYEPPREIPDFKVFEVNGAVSAVEAPALGLQVKSKISSPDCRKFQQALPLENASILINLSTSTEVQIADAQTASAINGGASLPLVVGCHQNVEKRESFQIGK